MNKREFVKMVVSKTTFEVNDCQVEEVLDIAANEFFKLLRKDGKAKFWNLFIAEIKDRQERSGVNPKNGKRIIIPAKRVVKTKPTTALNRVVEDLDDE